MNNKTITHSKLVNILATRKNSHPRFSLLLGAGASVSSGVKSATEMIAEWRKMEHRNNCCDGKSVHEHLQQFHWYNQGEEYSTLFERVYDEPSQRREYIEECISTSTPSWGYIYLVNLLCQRIFDTVFTTNFDDLIADACYKFSQELKPIVCAHDSSIRSVRVTSHRPKIIKLHGDFLFDDIKNTLTELENLEVNMRSKFAHFSKEYGMIVVGYGGNDRSVMDIIESLLRQDDTFPGGVYWCVRDSKKISPRVERLLRYDRVRLVQIKGFDEFFADLHEGMAIELQSEISDPYGCLAKRLNELQKNASIPDGTSHPVIARHMEQLSKTIEQIAKRDPKEIDPSKHSDIEIQVADSTVTLPIPYRFLAVEKERKGQYEEAFSTLLYEIKHRPALSEIAYGLSLIRRHGLDISKRHQLVKLLYDRPDLYRPKPDNGNDVAVQLMHNELWDEAAHVIAKSKEAFAESGSKDERVGAYLTINELQIKIHSGKPLTDDDKIELMLLQESHDPFVKMGASIVLGDFEKSEELLKICVGAESQKRSNVLDWPILRILLPHLKEKKLKELIESSHISKRKATQAKISSN